MYARMAAGHFGSLQLQLGHLSCSGQRLAVRHNLSNHSPFLRGLRRERLWVEQERLRSSRASVPKALASNAGIGDVAEGREINFGNEPPPAPVRITILNPEVA
jgi:hypothetical protein